MDTKLLLIIATLFQCALLSACGGDDNQPNNNPSTSVPVTTPETPDSLCIGDNTQINWDALMTEDCPLLAQYGLFSNQNDPTQNPRQGGFLYQLSTQLFSNYANKYRFVFLPDGAKITFNPSDTFELPVGTVLSKTFALPLDTTLSGREHETIIETRLLIHRESGWTALPYFWHQGEAKLASTGADVSHTLNRQGEQLTFNYHVPSRAECKLCHQRTIDGRSHINPIGLKSQLLNHDIQIAGKLSNQLTYWQQQNWIEGLEDISLLTSAPEITDDSASLINRAKGYLDINCAHCHRAEGFASISGLRLGFHVDHTSYQYGICKQPPGWDGGEKGLSYDIIPGDAEHSIVLYRQELNSAKDRMPPIGRTLVHVEATEVIRQWIDSLSPTLGNCQQ